jgi:hypothetical protein
MRHALLFENAIIAAMSMLEMIPSNKCKMLDYECKIMKMQIQILS